MSPSLLEALSGVAVPDGIGTHGTSRCFLSRWNRQLIESFVHAPPFGVAEQWALWLLWNQPLANLQCLGGENITRSVRSPLASLGGNTAI